MPMSGRMEDKATPATDLLHAATTAAYRAYAPYSKFRVGCAIRTASGGIYTGCNVENESYPAGFCAERAALAAAVCGEGPCPEIREIVVFALGSDDLHAPCSPCGICRQVIAEIAPDAIVGFFSLPSLYLEMRPDELLPHSFKGQLK